MHVYLAIKNVNWEQDALVNSWKEIGDVSLFNFTPNDNPKSRVWWKRDRVDFQRRIIENTYNINKKKKIDLMFCYLSGRWIDPITIFEIRKNIDAPIVNLGFDDHHAFYGRRKHGRWMGNASIGKTFDLNITLQSPNDVKKYTSAGARAIFLPPGINPKTAPSIHSKINPEFDAVFIGGINRQRKKIVKMLKKSGCSVIARGNGWPEGPIPACDLEKTIAKGRVYLGEGIAGKTKKVALKARDIEGPFSKRPYLTNYNPLLETMFVPNKEILFYHNIKDAIKKVISLKENPEKASTIGKSAHRRVLTDHLWISRWKQVLQTLNIS